MQPLLSKKHWIVLVAIAGLCIATLCGARVWFANTKFTALQLLPLPQPVPVFQLYASNNSSFTQQQFHGHWSLVFLGFSHCADICPVELNVIAQVIGKLQQGAADNNIRGIFITLDPERDSQTVIDNYLAAFNAPTANMPSVNAPTVNSPAANAPAVNAKLVGLRGNHAELAKLTRFFGADYNRQLQINGTTINVPAGYAVPLGAEQMGAGQDYQVNHSARIYLINPGGQYLGSFPPPHDVQKMLEDLQMIIKR